MTINFDTSLIIHHYQPIIRMGANKEITIQSYEALCRYKNGDEILPAKFILDFLKDKGKLIELDRLTILNAAKAVGSLEGKSVNINISALSLLCVDLMIDCIQLKNLSDKIVIEITETERIEENDKKSLLKNVSILKSIGFRIAIDDFGDGFSSLSYLIKLSVDFVKISRSTLTDLRHTKEKAKYDMMRSIISAIKCNRVEIVFEGIEDASDLLVAKLIGADLYQGYYFGRPAPIYENEGQLRQINA